MKTLLITLLVSAILFCDTIAPVATHLQDSSVALKDSVTFSFGIGITAELIAPSSPFFNSLRSDIQNINEKDSMLQDAEEKFSNNDVTMSIGLSSLYRRIEGWQFSASLSWFGFENGCAWSPKDNDTLITASRANRYRLDCIRLSAGVQKNLPSDFLVADGYARLYVSAGIDGFPLVRLATERTSLNGKIVSFGNGYGFRVGLGAEKRISDKTLFLGEFVYARSRLSSLKENGTTVIESDVLRSGTNNALTIGLNSILFELKIVRGVF